MAKYEIPDEIRNAILNVIAKADIKGGDAPVIIKIGQILSNPMVEEKKETK